MKTLPLKTVTVLCLLMLFMGFPVKAQDGKPSKQETIEYIENYFTDDYFTKGEAFYTLHVVSKTMLTEINIKFHQLKIVDCALNFEYSERKHTMNTTDVVVPPETTFYRNTINLSDVESLKLSRYGDGNFIYQLSFNEKNKPNSKEPTLPFLRTSSDFDVVKETQLYKAFQHLRKLCGAPEPLKF
jgi:hypothetical protein